MKKTILILMTIVLFCFLLVGCGDKNDVNLEKTTNVTSEVLGELIDNVEPGSNLEEAASNIMDKITLEQDVGNNCPNECCTKDDEYDIKSCDFDKPCVNNKCVFEDCPYDCCSGYGKYVRKRCDEGYECLNNNCEAIDDDDDGLLNMKEEEIGTDPLNADTDGDGASDYEEYKTLKTDPLNENTDGDRYLDGEDPNPLIGVFPQVTVELNEGIQTRNDDNLELLNQAYIEHCSKNVCSVDDMLQVLGDIELFEVPFEIKRENTGDDYTEYTDFKIIIYTINSNKKRKTYPTIEEKMGRLDPDKKDSKEYNIIIKLSDLEVGGESVLVSAALESNFILLPELKSIEIEGESES